MSRVHEVEDKAKAPRLDKSATKRFIRNALWDAAQKTEKTNKSMLFSSSDYRLLFHTFSLRLRL